MDNYPVLSQIYLAKECTDDTLALDIPALIRQLLASDGLKRMQARETLICAGRFAVPELIKTLSNDNPQLRWQVIKVLEGIQEPSCLPALVECLKDENAGIRWAASGAIITFRRNALPALFEALTRDADNIWLRQGAHHILHMMKDYGRLNHTEEKVLDALKEVEAYIAVPWEAGKALDALKVKK